MASRQRSVGRHAWGARLPTTSFADPGVSGDGDEGDEGDEGCPCCAW
jgi:hypothetical protein